MSIGLLPKAGGDIATFIPLIFMMLLMIVGSMLILSLGKKAARASATLEVLVYAVPPIILLFIATRGIRRGIVPLEDNSYIEVSLVAGLLAGFLQFLIEFIEWSNKKLYQYSVRKLSGQTKNGGNFLRRVGDQWKQRNTIMGQRSNIWSWLTIAVILSVPQIVLFAGIQYYISESIGSAERLSLHIATGSLSVTVIIALLVYWLQKSDADKEQLHRQRAAMTSIRYAIENGISWMIGAGDDILGAAATIKETVNQYRQELLDMLTEQEYNEMILVVEGINDVIAASRNEDVDACVTENNRAKMFRPWINTIRWNRYRSYLAMAEDYHDLLSEMMINLLNALGGTYTFERSASIPNKDHKPLLEWDGKKITIHQGEELVLVGNFDVDESAGDFVYSAYEQYGMNIIPFMNSETYIEHYHLADCYVADLKVEGDTEQLVNIRTLEQYLEKKNPKRLQHLREMMELEKTDEDCCGQAFL